jgi:hypothetical protein
MERSNLLPPAEDPASVIENFVAPGLLTLKAKRSDPRPKKLSINRSDVRRIR